MLRPNPEFVQFQNWMAIPNWNAHVGLLCSLYLWKFLLGCTSLQVYQTGIIYIFICMLLLKQALVQLENWMD
jgi:hypothetical protein